MKSLDFVILLTAVFVTSAFFLKLLSLILSMPNVTLSNVLIPCMGYGAVMICFGIGLYQTITE